MNKLLKTLIFLSILVILTTSCKSVKNMYYVADLNQQVENIDSVKLTITPKIQIGDRISIIVSCPDPSQTSFLNPFNNQNPGANGVQNSTGYLVDSIGEVDFPLIGRIKVLGLSSIQTSEIIKTKLRVFFKDPYVYVTLYGKVYIVNGRGGYNVSITNERLTIFEALAQQGSYEPDDKWNEVLIVREIDGKRTTAFVDLTSKTIFNSPYYYLSNNDLIYVKPGKLNSTLRATNAVRSTIGLATGILALIILLVKK